MSDANDTKICTKCKTEYPATLEYFHACQTCKGKLRHQCIPCSTKRKLAWSQSNREKVNATQRARTARINALKPPKPKREKKVLTPEERRVSYLASRDRILEYSKQYYQRRKDDPEYKKTRQEWIRNNRDKARARWHRRQALIKNGGGSYTIEELEQLKSIMGLTCFYCDKSLDKYIIEHMYPITAHGSNTIDNIVLSCQGCNNRKHHKMPWVFCGKIRESDFYLSETGYRWKEHPLHDITRHSN